MVGKRLGIIMWLAVGALLLAGCTFVEVQNLSDVSVRVMVRVPDSSASSTRFIESGAVGSFFSTHGGRYTVATLPNEEYRQLVLDVREQLGERLFSESQTLTASEVAEIVRRMQQLTDNLDSLETEQGSCSGNVPDFESAFVTITWDGSQNRWALSCG